MRLHSFLLTWVACFLLGFVSQPLMGQAATGALTGTVTDPTGAVIPGADIALVEESTGSTRRTIANDQGYFAIQAVPAGTYRLEVEMPGFARWQRTGIIFYSGDRRSITDIVLQIGSTAEEITVSAAPDVMVPVDSGDKAQIITEGQIRDLSVVGRSAVELMKILPGVVFQAGSTSGDLTGSQQGVGGINVAGTREDALDIVSDGANVIDPGCNCGAIVTPNVDMVQEVVVQTGNFSAEHGKGPAVISSVSKAGTSEFHGSAYTYVRHHRLNSQDWRANRFGTDKPQDKFIFPGFTIGGPVLIPGSNFNRNRDKLFFFAGFEWWLQDIDLGLFETTVPTQAMRQGDFSELPGGMFLNGYDIANPPCSPGDDGNVAAHCSGPYQVNQALFDPGGRVLAGLYPLPNRNPNDHNGFNFVSNIVRPTNRNQQLVRIDYSISDNTKLYSRFNHEGQNDEHPYTLWWNNSRQVPYPTAVKEQNISYSSSTSLVNVLDPTTTNEVVFAVSYLNLPNEFVDRSKVSREALGYPYKGIFKSEGMIVPNVTDWNGGVADIIQPGGFDPVLFAKKWIVSVNENFSKVINTHSLKIGAFFQLTTNDQPTSSDDHGLIVPTTWGGNSTGNAYADLLLGRTGFYHEFTRNLVGEMRQRELSFFVQDSWKVSRRLTLELGSRFYHYGFMYDKNGFIASFDPARYDPNSAITDYTGIVAAYLGDDVPRSGFDTPFLRVGPRFGFAYDLTGDGATVLRGGYGKFYYRDQGNVYFGAIGNPPLQLNTVFGWNPGTLAELENLEPQFQKSRLIVLDKNDSNIPLTHSWSLTVSQRMPGAFLLETSYVGNTSRNQISPDGYNINVVPEGAMFGFPLGDNADNYRPFDNYGPIGLRSHFLSQHYNSLQLLASRQTGAFNFQSSYTFSKVLGVGGGFYGSRNVDNFDMRRRSYGPLNYDRTHTLAIAYNYLLPDFSQTSVLRELVNGWQVSGITQFQSGGPLSLGLSGTMANGDSIGSIQVAGTPDTSARAFIICDPREGLGANQYANPACFAAPTPGSNGHYQTPYMKHPGFQNHDFSLFKNFQVGTNEDHKLQVRVSGYNFLNHPIPLFVGGNETQLNFSNGELTQQTLDLLGRPQTKRGRRLMQIALKFYF
jgi:hypothetical protein